MIDQPSANGSAAETLSDAEVARALCCGDEAAYRALLDRYHGAMVRVARLYVSDDVVVDDVVQETWLEVFRGIRRFEGRSSLKTWIFRILTNIARTRGRQEARSVPFSALGETEEGQEPSVPAAFFLADGPWRGHWVSGPQPWADIPEERLLSAEMRDVMSGIIALLPANQRAVMTMRDLDGWLPEEISHVLGVTDGHQRVLLHRARSKVRAALERYFRDEQVVAR